MEGISLLAEAKTAGLTVRLENGQLVIRGPRKAARIAHRLLAHKGQVIAALLADRDEGQRQGRNHCARLRNLGWQSVHDIQSSVRARPTAYGTGFLERLAPREN